MKKIIFLIIFSTTPWLIHGAQAPSVGYYDDDLGFFDSEYDDDYVDGGDKKSEQKEAEQPLTLVTLLKKIQALPTHTPEDPETIKTFVELLNDANKKELNEALLIAVNLPTVYCLQCTQNILDKAAELDLLKKLDMAEAFLITNNLDVEKALISKGLDVNAEDKKLGSLLYKTAISKHFHYKKYEALIKAGATTTPEIALIKDLRDAAYDYDAHKVRKILEENKDYRTKTGESLADIVLYDSVDYLADDEDAKIEIFDIALDFGADPNKELKPVLSIEGKDYIELALLELLCKHKVNINSANDQPGLLKRLSIDNPELAILLIKKGIEIPNEDKKSIEQTLKSYESNDKDLAIKLDRHIKLMREFKERFLQKEVKQQEEKKASESTNKTPSLAHLRTWFDDKDSKLDTKALIDQMITTYYSDSGVKKLYGEHAKGIPDNQVNAYKDLCYQMIKKEEAMPNYYCFYHAHNTAINLLFDLNKKLNEWLTINISPSIALRIKSTIKQPTLDGYINYLEQHFKDNPASDSLKSDPALKGVENIWDNYETYRDADDREHTISNEVLSVNLGLFGNAEKKGTSSFFYFLNPRSSSSLRPLLIQLFDNWGFNKRYIPQLLLTHLTYSKKLKNMQSGGMLQIFIPKDKVDQFVFLSHPYGTPYRQKIAPSFDEKLNRHTKISDILEKYVQNPSDDKEVYLEKKQLNELEARIAFLPEFFMPDSGIVYKTYDFSDQSSYQEYMHSLDLIVREMFSEWIAKERFNQLATDDKNLPLIKLLRLIKEGEENLKEREVKESKEQKPSTRSSEG